MKRTKKNADFIEYVIESFDFNEDMLWEDFCTVTIDLSGNCYKYEFLGRFKDEKIIPPTVYGLGTDERSTLLDTKFSEYGYGAWSMRINNWINIFIQKRYFPEEYPK